MSVKEEEEKEQLGRGFRIPKETVKYVAEPASSKKSSAKEDDTTTENEEKREKRKRKRKTSSDESSPSSNNQSFGGDDDDFFDSDASSSDDEGTDDDDSQHEGMYDMFIFIFQQFLHFFLTFFVAYNIFLLFSLFCSSVLFDQKSFCNG